MRRHAGGMFTSLNKAGCRLSASSSWDCGHNPDMIRSASGNPWHAKGSGTHQWIKFAFPRSVTVDGFRTAAHSGWDGSAFKDYRFESSDDGSSWSTVKSGVGQNQDCCSWQEIRFTATTAEYFRLYMIDDWGYKFLSINHLELAIGTGECTSKPANSSDAPIHCTQTPAPIPTPMCTNTLTI